MYQELIKHTALEQLYWMANNTANAKEAEK